MNDEQIIGLYFRRDEAAITESKKKYGAYCMKIAMCILRDVLDSEECVNDTWFGAWRSIPPKQPKNLAAYLGKITRNLSINRYEMKYAEKRLVNEFTVSLDELGECISDGSELETQEQAEILGACISDFLHQQKALDRRIFVSRYFYCESIAELAARYEISESRVKSLLFRMRGKLKLYLQKNGITV